ncbi:heterokaryon incompatibility protein-domain-containing protein [Apodospora peruviana]|uniref:Heterokaryon incompatibility protein-domain-containing protein n=1 Tax=Apodospora peruviana TaxID=516989 RepID=A0AAE0LYQ8_9PEZI|nr:heterokaryon incompatibility protein-domain-containing protein [Apodospora peruviana]
MPPLKPLCEYCAKIPLQDLVAGTKFTLGSGARVKNSDCPLCRVVVTAFRALYHTDTWDNTLPLSKETDVGLHWYSSSGPGGRGGFTIDPTYLANWICMAPSASNDRPAADHEYLRPTVGAEFPIARLEDWISACTKYHSDRCRVKTGSFEDSFPGLEVVRFIDVKRSSIVELRTVPHYVALSYVWGEVSTVRLTATSRPGLLLPGGIEKAWQGIPRTIKDAIELVRKLGVRYLWVDALCLIQNDPDDVSRGVKIMDEIYERSWLTIIAASGHNANGGLPGIHENSRCSSAAVPITEDVSVGLFVPLDRLLKCSVYETRAWTFQEQLLARRAVYFVDGHVFFRCREDVYAEQLMDQSPRGGRPLYLKQDIWSSILPTTAALDDPLHDFANMLIYYSQRALTLPSDTIRALAGITRRVSQLSKCRFLQGIPTAVFDAFLIFESNTRSFLRRRQGFPSYSWAGWKGGLVVTRRGKMFENLNEWLEEYTWIVWYKRSPSGVLNPVWDPSANESFPFGNWEYPGYRRRRPFQCPRGVYLNSTRTYPTQDLASSSMQGTDYPLLQFWTVSVHFNLEPGDDFTGYAYIVTAKGARVGTISLDGAEETTIFTTQDRFEFILLSRVMEDSYIMEPRREEDRYFVLLLEWNGDVAERRGLGLLNISAVADSLPPGPRWKEILLG